MNIPDITKGITKFRILSVWSNIGCTTPDSFVCKPLNPEKTKKKEVGS